MTTQQPEPAPAADGRQLRIIIADEGRISSDSRKPLSKAETWISDADTGAAVGPGTDLPAGTGGVIEQHPDGREVLETVDGMTLELDGRGGLTVNGYSASGIFTVVQAQDS